MRMKSASVRKPGDEDPGAGSQLHKEKKYKGFHVCDSGENQVPKDTVELDTDFAKELQRWAAMGHTPVRSRLSLGSISGS